MAELWADASGMPGAFVRWWTGELAGLLPRGAGSASSRLKSCLVLVLSGDEMVLIEQTARRGPKELGRASGEQEHRALARLDDRRYRNWPVVVRLGGDLGLRKTVDLPLAARDDLDQLLHFELDRLTPFKVDDVCFAWRVRATDHQQNRMQVDLEMAPKTVVDRALQPVRERGREVDRVELLGAGDHEPLDLMPRAADLPEEGVGRSRYVLPLLVLVLAIAAVAIPLREQRGLIDQLDRQIAIVRIEAEESLALRERLDALMANRHFLAAAKNDRAAMTEILAELTRLIPDHSHLTQLQIRGLTVELSGLAEKASDLIAILDRSPMLSAPQFRSPVTRDASSGKERFQISAELIGQPS